MYRLLLMAVLLWLVLPVAQASGGVLTAASRTSSLIMVAVASPRALQGQGRSHTQSHFFTNTAPISVAVRATDAAHRVLRLAVSRGGPIMQWLGLAPVASRIQAANGELEENDGTERPSIPVLSLFAVVLLSFIILIAVARTILIRRL